MKKNKERLDHGLHNEKACTHLELNKEFSDWIITTAFYSALQFVSYKIFPIEICTNGRKLNIHDISQYQNLSNKKDLSRHAVLSDLVFKHCSDISEDYDWLKDMSMTARYVNYQHPPEVANKAKTLMLRIKKHCTAEKLAHQLP